ncbi:glycosyltransferase [Vibrio hippocampi]|uniref:UDP-N-acetylglucosamine--peptide N-acetylglucosaminyltransferase GtfA subunit n=1 Tax=Vibrio hippocampi TaxID=654686 RepID=A0ABN8DIT4_9VIBR|nr:glycosyltransferase [Vibrio hippocampi]CAH0529054.1 UDP-N-acetylglucosamine--peptide N-acetylglucosaminyltransferase GtfA subunit [Vibrio hippocampi]
MKSKKILFVHKDFVTSGGVERVTLNLANQFREDGHKVSFFISSSLTEQEVEIINDFDYVTATGGFFAKVRKLSSFIERGKFDVVVGAKEQANILIWACYLKNRRFTPVLARHCAFDVSDQKLSPRMLKLLYNVYAASGIKIVSVSKALQDYIRDNTFFNKSKVSYCPNPVVSDKIYHLAQNNTENFQFNEPYYCSVGRLCEQKGFDLLLHAYAQAKQQNPELPKLVIVGEGPDKESLEALSRSLGLEGNVFFAGFNRNPYFIMKHSEGFILSSRHEGLPTVLIEALALQSAIVSFDCPTGPKEILKQGELGYLVENGNVDALARSIVKAYKAPIKYAATAASEYGYKVAAEQYYKVFSGA